LGGQIKGKEESFSQIPDQTPENLACRTVSIRKKTEPEKEKAHSNQENKGHARRTAGEQEGVEQRKLEGNKL